MFDSTLLTGDTKIDKALLDLLKKINSIQIQAAPVAALPAGVILEYAGETAPDGFLMCFGTELKRADYRELFGKIGVVWGAGDGISTFNIPDRIGAAGVGAGTSKGFIENETFVFGQKYDDQVQDHGHMVDDGTSEIFRGGASSSGPQLPSAPRNLSAKFSANDIQETSGGVPRVGMTTRGKVIALNYIIKY